MSETNRFGLSRDIPTDVKRLVRQQCGFGCVVCGSSIIEYEHVEPAFVDAESHEASRIALLCPQCHAKVTRGQLSKETVRAARLSPKACSRGFANEFFDLGATVPVVQFGGMRIAGCKIPIRIESTPILEVDVSEEEQAPFRLSAAFTDSAGRHTLSIVENEWRIQKSVWDFEAVGPRLTVREKKRHISLQLRADPPTGIIVERIHMQFGPHTIVGNTEYLAVRNPAGNEKRVSGSVENFYVGIQID